MKINLMLGLIVDLVCNPSYYAVRVCGWLEDKRFSCSTTYSVFSKTIDNAGVHLLDPGDTFPLHTSFTIQVMAVTHSFSKKGKAKSQFTATF